MAQKQRIIKDFKELINTNLQTMLINKLNVLQTYLSQYRIEIVQTELEYIGKGSYAEVFRYNQRVFKVTTNPEDFVIAKKLIKRDNESFVQVFTTVAVKYKDRTFYIIEAEYAGKVVGVAFKQHSFEVNAHMKTTEFFRGVFHTGIGRKYSLNDFLEWFYFWEDEDKRQNLEYVTNLYHDYVVMFKNILKMKVKTFDYHDLNVVYKNRVLKIVDFGASEDSRKLRTKVIALKS